MSSRTSATENSMGQLPLPPCHVFLIVLGEESLKNYPLVNVKTVCDMEHGPVEIVDLPVNLSKNMVDLSSS